MHLLGTCHHHEVLSSQKMLEVLPWYSRAWMKPLADRSMIPTFLLSQMTSKCESCPGRRWG